MRMRPGCQSGGRTCLRFQPDQTIMARSLESTLEDVLQDEGYAQAICFQSEDHKEGVAAFYEKRKAEFSGK